MEEVTWRKGTKNVPVKVNVVLSVNLIVSRRNPHTNTHTHTHTKRPQPCGVTKAENK
jgi:hypothetical protein